MKWVVRGFVTLIGLTALILVAGYGYLQTSLPDTEGNISLAGLKHPVEVVRDRSGIPHITAKTTEDAVFTLGFVHAQDRLWQMEMNRRTGAGRLSEILGDATVSTDKFLRTVGFYQSAKEAFERFDEETKKGLLAYTAGVNAYLEQRSGSLPAEFLILGVTPEKWSPIDSVVWTKMMAWDLGKNWSTELARMQLATTLPLSQVSEFFPAYPGEAQEPLPDFSTLYKVAGLNPERLMAAAPETLPPSAGSNNWVVSGSKTNTGKPLLANDPHLGLAAPALWYFAHLKTPEFETIGATLPGVPGVILGRNKKIAWGFTNTGPDTQDLYIEKINPDNPEEYKTPEGWARFQTRKETIRVKDQDPVDITVRITRHGPVLSDVYEKASKTVASGHVLAFAWTSLLDQDTTPMTSLKMAKAQNWADFKEAIRYFTSPQQNMVYADTDGNIGYYAPALVPIRDPANKAAGRIPVPGWDAKYDWKGFIPFEELPQAYNPAKGFHFTANQKIVPPTYPHFITHDWNLPYRAMRIKDRLELEEQHSVQTFIDLHGDVQSLMAEEFLEILLTTKPADDFSRQALTALSTWDGQMTMNDKAPLIFNAWIRELNKAIYADETGDYFKSLWRHRPIFLKNVLLNTNGQGHWCDNKTTDANVESCEDILQSSLYASLEDLKERYGADMEAWNWGEAHFAHSDHLPFSKVGVLRNIFDIRVPSSGGIFTVNVGRNRMEDDVNPFANVHAASLRAIYDFSDLDKSLYMHSTGQSGNILSPFYSDMASDWANLKYRQMSMTNADYSEGAFGTLTLTPALK